MQTQLEEFLAANPYNIAAIDHGNGAVKTPHFIFSCGVTSSQAKPLLAPDGYIRYNGRYYTTTKDVPPYRKDKTTSQDLLIMTLLALGKEAEKGYIDLDMPIRLAIGLPPTHLQDLSNNMQKYFSRFLKAKDGQQGCVFSYNGKKYQVSMKSCFVLPQCSTAAMAYMNHSGGLRNELLAKGFADYIFVDIGAQTVDVNYIINANDPARVGFDLSRTGTIELGAHVMEEAVRDSVDAETGLVLSNDDIENVIMGRPCQLTDPEYKPPGADEAVRAINETYAAHVHKILAYIRSKNRNWATVPWLLMGNAALLFERGIRDSEDKPSAMSVIDEPRANAIGYYAYTEALLKAKGHKGVR